MYAMPMGPSADGTRRRIFFEETSLVARPPMSFDECKRRMERRLRHLGVTVHKVEEEEFCYIPMGGVLPKREQRVVAFGGSLGLVHPATGYQICRALAAAGPAARAIATEVGLGVGGWLVCIRVGLCSHTYTHTHPKRNETKHSSAAPAPPTTRTRPRAACTTACGATSSGCSGTFRCLAGSSSWSRMQTTSAASSIPSSASPWRSGRCVGVGCWLGWVGGKGGRRGLVWLYGILTQPPSTPNISSHHTDTSQPHPPTHPPTGLPRRLARAAQQRRARDVARPPRVRRPPLPPRAPAPQTRPSLRGRHDRGPPLLPVRHPLGRPAPALPARGGGGRGHGRWGGERRDGGGGGRRGVAGGVDKIDRWGGDGGVGGLCNETNAHVARASSSIFVF